MNLVRISSRLAATGAVTALAAAALVGVGATAANAATVTNTYTCSIPDIYTGDFPVTVTGELPVPSYFAGATVPAGLLSITVSAAVPADAQGLLSAFAVDNAKADNFGFALGSATVPAPIAGPFSEDGTTWNATGANGAFTTPGPGHYDALLPTSFTLMTYSGENQVAPLSCVLKTGETPQVLTSIDLVKQTSTTTTPAKVIVKKGKVAKVPAKVAAQASTATGKVIAREGTTKLDTASLKNGKAVLNLGKLKVGKHKITITYKGNPNVIGSSDKTVVKVVRP